MSVCCCRRIRRMGIQVVSLSWFTFFPLAFASSLPIRNETKASLSPVCGLQGKISTRIADCHSMFLSQNDSKGRVTWSLVTSVPEKSDSNKRFEPKKIFQVWRDNISGLFWSDMLEDNESWCEAAGRISEKGICSNDSKISLCEEKPGFLTPKKFAAKKGFLSHVKWRLPTKEDWESAEKHGVREVLPNLPRWFWAETDFARHVDFAWQFNAFDGFLSTDSIYYTHAVRCVGDLSL